MKKIALVTGISGCLGRAVVKALHGDSRAEWEIHGVIRPSTDQKAIEDLKPFMALKKWKDLDRVDVTFHCAGNTDHNAKPQRLMDDNVSLTETMIEVHEHFNGGCFIHTSTGAVHLYDEFTTQAQVRNWYAYTKLQAEQIVKTMDTYIILQPCIILGTHDRRNYSKLFDMAMQGKIKGSLEGSIEFGWAEDIAQAHVDAFWNGKRNETYMLGGVVETWQNFLMAICDIVGKPKNLKVIPKWKLKLMAMWQSFHMRLFGGEKPVLNSAMIDLLARDARVPHDEWKKSYEDLFYVPTLNVRQMLEKVWEWKKGTQ